MENKSFSPSPNRWWDLPSVFLLLVVTTASFTRLIATQWTEGLTITRTLCYLGLAAGLALGYSKFPPRIAALFATAYGLFAVPWRLGLTLGEGILWQERLVSLAGRLSVTINQLARQQAVTDNLLFLTLMSALYWTLSVYAGYSLTRYASPWRTVLPMGLTMVVIHSYDAYLTSRVWYLVLYLFFALLLVTRLVFLHRRKQWEQTNTYMPPHLGVDFIRVALAATVILLLLSWTAPAMADSLPAAQSAWQQIKRPWDRVRDNFDNAFASLRSSVGIVNDYYGTNLSLGRGNRLSDNVVFTVQTPPNPPQGVRYYWRARIFDVYNEGGWSSTLTNGVSMQPSDFTRMNFPTEANRGPGQYSFSFTVDSPIATLFSAPQPVWVSRPARVEIATNPDGTADLGSLRATPALQPGDTYSVRSSLSDVTIAQMRQSGTQYPDWVIQRYLQLPAEVTPRTQQLALDITAGIDNPYDKAAAITSYLRQNIQYSETIPPLPNNQDPIDWFLFDLKQGFCNYYASAEVILLRSIGIPARMAVGYAQGGYDETTKLFTVRQRDAHAWPEVYFSDLGWIEFEPTAGQPELARPLGQQQNDINPNIPTMDELRDRFNTLNEKPDRPGPGVTSLAQKRARIWQIAIIVGLILLAGVIVVPMGWKNRLMKKLPPLPIMLETGFRRAGLKPPSFLRSWANRASLSPLGRAYQEVNRALRRLGKPPVLAHTPAERVSILSKELPAAGDPAQRLLIEYQTATYGQKTPDLQAARLASEEIRSLSLRAFFQRIMRGRQDQEKNLSQKYRS